METNMLSDTDFCGGIYKVDDKVFSDKVLACIECTNSKSQVFPYWNFYQDIWKDAVTVRKYEGADLRKLYKIRAQQLRDKHDYLILSYSGGSDSWTVLNTFMINDIFIDEIVVNWPVKATQGPDAIYKYNIDIANLDAGNYLSEWDAFLGQELEDIKKVLPNTKVTIMDWSETILSDPPDASEALAKPYFQDLVQVRIMGVKTESEKEAIAKGLSVGYIYGTDKPILKKVNNFCYLQFCDASMRHNVSRTSYGSTIEYFYISPEMPEICIESSYKILSAINKDPTLVAMMDELHKPENWKTFRALVTTVCRPDYKPRFQTNIAANQALHHGKYQWAQQSPTYKDAFDRWYKILDTEYFSKINPRLLIVRNEIVCGLKTNYTEGIKLGEFA